MLYKKNLCGHLSFNSNKDYYFGSYSHFGMHEEMLSDEVRTHAYRDSIRQNKHLFEGKTVLDIGCGTGILSLFAVRDGGAKHVFAVDMADINVFAQEIAKVNGYEKKITVIKGKIEDAKKLIPKHGIDVIISEWMGYFLVYESMLDSIIQVRDYFLKPNGKSTIWPNKVKMYVAAFEDSQHYKKKVTHWKDVYGFDMSCMQPAVVKEAQIDEVAPTQIVSNMCKILDLDLNKMKMSDVNFSSQYSLKINQDTQIHGLASWFDCEFIDDSRPRSALTLSTSPFKKVTHWK